MKIELKNIKHAQFASEETNCYQATLYVDGIRTATVGNDGHGGCDYQHPFEGQRDRLRAAEVYCEALPAIVSEFTNDDGSQFSYPNSLENMCGEILTNWLITRDVKRALKKAICFVKPNVGGVFEYKVKPSQDLCVEAQKREPTFTILNLLPIEDAVAKWTEAEERA